MCVRKQNLEYYICEVMKHYGYSITRLLEQFHQDSSRLICKVSAGDKLFLIRGLPEATPRHTIESNTFAHEYLGNQKKLAPGILSALDGTKFIQLHGYWFYVLEYIKGDNLKETKADEYELGQVLRTLHGIFDYPYPSSLDEDKSIFYKWFPDRAFKQEFDAIVDTLPDFKMLDRCFIHSDMGPHNSLRTTDGKVLLIDLDDSGTGSRYLDLGWPFIMQFVDHNHATGEMHYRFDLATAFLQGYYGTEHITSQEYHFIWQGAIFMHISYMQEYGPKAVGSLWNILKFGISQKDRLWELLEESYNLAPEKKSLR